MKTCRRKWLVQWVAAFVSIVLFGTYLGSLSMNTLTVSAICCRKDGFDKSRYTLTGNVAQDVATIAKSQAGRTCSDFGYSGVDYGAWCDEYVADCLENAGCDDSIVAHGGTVADFEKKMRKRGAVVVSSPQPGDLLFFSWSHVEIVTRVEGGTVYCAGGNNQGKTYPGGRCAGERNAQSVANSMGGSIRLYLRPNYKGVVPPKPKGYIMSESEGAGQTIPDGDYWLLSALSRNFWIDIPGDEISTNGANVTTYIRDVNQVPSQYDAWTVTYLNNGYYKIRQKDTNLCLDVSDASLYAGTNVQIVNDNGAPAQQWSIIPTQTGYKLQSRCNSFVLDVTNGIIESNTNIMVWESNEQKTQRFGFIPYGTDADRIVKDGTYRINSKVSEAYCIDAAGEAAKNEYKNGTNIQLWTNDGDDIFKIIYSGGGYYKIQEPVSGLYLEVVNDGNPLDTQTNIQLYKDNDSLGQYWKIRKNSNNTYTLVSELSGYNLDLEDGKLEQGQNISQHFNNDSAPQQWMLKSVGYVMSESEGAGQTIPDGDYWLLSALSRNFWIDIPGDEISTNGANVTTYIRDVNQVPSQYDAWTVTYLNNGYYKIRQKDTNLCLDVSDASLYAGTNVQIVNDNGAPAQQWSIIPTQTGYKLQSRCNSFVLDVTNGIIESNTNIMVWESNEQKTQRFGFIPYGTDADRIVKDGTYRINSKVSEAYCIDAAGEAAKNEYKNGTNIQLWTNDGDDIFKIIYSGGGYYKIQEPVSGLYLEVVNDGNPLDTQTNIQLYKDNDSLGQYWKIRKNSNNTYTLVSELSGYNLDLEDGKLEQGQNISQHFNNDSTAQQWVLKSIYDIIKGDCNNDGEVTTADAVLLQRYLLQERTLTQSQWQTADLNADGTVNGYDLALLRQKLVG